MTSECPQCKAALPRQGSRFCNQCGAEVRLPEDDGQSTAIPTPAAFPEPTVLNEMTMPPELTTTDSMPPSGGASDKGTLRILLRDGSIIERELGATETKIGKGPQNDIILADPAVSTAHAMIRRESQGYVLVDVGSRNGTFLNEDRVTDPRPLRHGDVVKMGRCTLTFRFAPTSQTVMLDRPPVPAAAHHQVQEVSEENFAAALIAGGLSDQPTIERLRGADAKGRRLFRALIEEKLVSDVDLRDLISSKFGIPIVDVSAVKVDQATANALTPRVMRDQLMIPGVARNDLMPLVVADPTDSAGIERAKKTARRTIELRLAAASEIATQIDQLFAPRLVGVLPTGEKIERLVSQPEIEIGKAAHNQIVLNFPTVSNTHAIIIARDGGYSIIDLGSSNGTFVNGQRLGDQPHTLQHGDKVQIAEIVLTYRNPAETTENKTARLSPEVLEEVRRRAGITSGAMPAAAFAGGAAAVATPSAANLDKKAQNGEKKKEKKKEEKKKDDDRMKAALLNSTSRLLATVLSSILTIAGTLYLVKWTQSGGAPGLGGGNKQVQNTSKLTEPGAFTLLQGGTFEASGAVWIPDTNTVLLVDDGKPGQVLTLNLDENGRQQGTPATINLGAQVIDPESITYDGSAWFYIVSSHGEPQNAAQNGLLRFAYDRESRTVRGTPEVVTDLRPLLMQVPELKAEGAAAGSKGGLNIEGITWDPNNGRLLLGLRSPLLSGSAIIVPLKLKNPLAPMTNDNVQLATPIIRVDLGGQGIRDLDYNPQLKSYLILSGATELSEKTDFGLWEWTGEAGAAPRREVMLDEKAKPEGLTNVTINGKNFLFIVGDASRYLKLDYIN
jgi:pSer/pThr/pTyr-binding forkhead associated (FHA) protein